MIKPGEPKSRARSADAISGDKPEMPKTGPPLSKEEVALIRRWIESGARLSAKEGMELADTSKFGANWWSLKPLVHPACPS